MKFIAIVGGAEPDAEGREVLLADIEVQLTEAQVAANAELNARADAEFRKLEDDAKLTAATYKAKLKEQDKRRAHFSDLV